MQERPFPDQSIQPSEPAIQAALGNTYACYQKITGLASAYAQEWTFTKSSGWMLKIYDRKKALLYLIPLNGGFKISLAIREQEREALLRDDALAIIYDKIAASKKYSEGFALQFDIANENEFQPVELFIRKLIVLRG